MDAEQLAKLAKATEDLSGRDLRDVAEHTERRWASKVGKHRYTDTNF
jgi:hypothetical protein